MQQPTIHTMPSVFVLEHDVPEEMVKNLNKYLDSEICRSP